jgi:hypothetical protein|tara:strand:+ start:308 stop:520 length:213 start_codon:yes stop_codon:yes gene_type:complete
MIYDKVFNSDRKYMHYLLKHALAEVEIFKKTSVTIEIHNEDFLDELSDALAVIFLYREDVEIYIKLAEVH